MAIHLKENWIASLSLAMTENMASSTKRKPTSQLKPREILGFHKTLDIWYCTNGRHDLPWRMTGDPYSIWVSEVMLQQTQVATVRDRFYTPFLKTFPTIETLASAPRQKVLKAWEGLGYYRRAVHLHEAAKAVVRIESRESNEDFSPLPRAQRASLSRKRERVKVKTSDSRLSILLSLPGIGKNTAHAILAFAYHEPYPVLEANVKRVIARIFAQLSDKDLWQFADILLNRKNPFDHNQAMMDLGAMICTPKGPQCDSCPANSICKGKQNPTAYPQKKVKKATPTKHAYIIVKRDARGRFFLTRRDAKLLGGFYGFEQHPRLPSPRRPESPSPLIQLSKEITAYAGMAMEYLGSVKHVYSHFKLEAETVLVRVAPSNSNGWYTKTALKKLPLSKVDLKVLELL